MNREVEEFVSSRSFAETTKRTYRDLLSALLAECNFALLSASDLLALVRRKGWENARQCVALAACKSFIAWKFGEQHPALAAKLKRVTGRPQRALDTSTVLRLLASFNPHEAKGARDLALCSLALDTGLRASELCRLRQADTDTVGRVLQVIVKGGQWKAAVFSDETAVRIEHWKVYRERLGVSSALFANVLTANELTPEGLYKVVEGWGSAIGVKVSPHDLRRSFAVLATMNGAPERVLMEGGRWSNSGMITRYTRTLKLEAMREYLPVSRLKA